MIKVLSTRPISWDGKQTENIEVRSINIGNELRDGSIVQDGIGTCMNKIGKRELVQAFEEFKPDYFLFVVHFGFFSLKFLQYLKKTFPKTKFVHWSGNQVLDKKHNLCWYTYQMRSCIDYIFTNTTDKIRIDLIKKNSGKKVFTLYDFGFDPDYFTKPSEAPKVDCFFGGGTTVSEKLSKGRFPFSDIRQKIMIRLNENYDAEVRGGYWPFKSKPGLHGLDYFQAIQRAKIVLGTYHLDFERYYTKRTIFSGASGRPYLVRYIPGMETDFENYENILWYKSEDECFEILDYYLENEIEREQLGKRQREHFEIYHSWAARLQNLDRLIMEIESR